MSELLSHHRPKPLARSGSRSKDGGGKPMTPADDVVQQEEHVRRRSTLSIWLVTAGAAAVVLLVGLTYGVLTGGWPISPTGSTQASSAPTFVGSEDLRRLPPSTSNSLARLAT